jgi:hypothetical protein
MISSVQPFINDKLNIALIYTTSTHFKAPHIGVVYLWTHGENLCNKDKNVKSVGGFMACVILY